MKKTKDTTYTATFPCSLCVNSLGIFPAERFICAFICVCMDDARISYAGQAIV